MWNPYEGVRLSRQLEPARPGRKSATAPALPRERDRQQRQAGREIGDPDPRQAGYRRGEQGCHRDHIEEGRWSSGGQGGSYIAFDPSGRYFVVANAHTGWAVFRNETEPELIATMRNEGSGPHLRQGRSHPHCAIFTPDNAWIYAADMGSDEILAFPFDGRAGRVGDKIRAYRAAPGSGPRHVLPRHGLMYLLNELGNTLVVLRPEADGTLTEVQSVSTLPADFTGDSHTAHLGMSRDGRHLYVSNRGHDSLTVYDVGAEGRLTPRQWIPSGGKWPWFFALTEDSRMIVANNVSDAVTIFDIDAHGELRASDQVTVRRPIFIASLGIGRSLGP